MGRNEPEAVFYIYSHRFPDFFKIQKLFSSTVIRVVKISRQPAHFTSYYDWYCGNKTVQ